MVTEITPWTLILNQGSVSANATMPTIAAGSNRIVLMGVYMFHGSGNALTPTAITANSITANRYSGVPTATSNCSLAFYIFTESQISSISGQTITSTGSGEQKSIIYKLLGDCSQSMSFAQNSGFASSGTMPAMPLTREAGSSTEAMAACGVSFTSLTMAEPSRDTYIELATGRRISLGYESDTARTVDFTVTRNTSTAAAVVNIGPVPAYLINSTNSGNPVEVGATFSSSVTGFTGITSGTIGGKALTGISYSSNTITATAPVYVDGATFYEPDTNQTLTYVNGSETASATIPTASPDGMTSVVIASPVTDDPTYIGSVYTLANGDRLVYPTLGGDFFVDADGKINALNAGTYVCWHWRVSDSVMTQVTLNISEAGAIVPPEPTTRPLGGRPIRSSIGRQIWPIAPHATNPVGGVGETKKAYGIKVSGAGTVVIRTEGGDEDVTITLAAGATLPVVVTHVRDTSTATGILGYSIY